MRCSRRQALARNPLAPAFPSPIGEALFHVQRSNNRDGFILITTLILLAGLTLLTITLYTLSINRTIQARNYTHTQRAHLAADSGFEAARAMLLQLTRSDGYFITSGEDVDPYDKLSSPYHFLSTPFQNGSTLHIPLWSGGIVQVTQPGETPQWARSETLPPADAVLAGLHELPVEQNPGRIALQPFYTSWVGGQTNSENKDQTLRYTFLIEDMEALPQLDVISKSHPNNQQTVRLGYSRFDPRIPEFVSTGRFASSPDQGTAFPGIFQPTRGLKTAASQNLFDAVAPGLSPKEIYLPAHQIIGKLASDAKNAAISGDILTSGGAGSFSDQVSGIIAVGLRPYLRIPYVPHGLGYPNGGQPKANLNALISAGPEALQGHLRTHLPAAWQNRGGNFPGDYLATLAANIIDYADTDSLPTTISRADGSNDEITLPVRGMDSYPVVNECYFRFRWISVETDNPSNPTSFSIRIEVTPFIEFWNQTNRPFPATTLSLVYAEGGKSLATGYQAEIGANLHKIDLEAVGNINSHEGTEGSLVLHRTIEVPENGFQVVEFPSVTYKFQNLALQPGEQQPEEFTLVGKEGAFDIGTYKILLGDQIIDWAIAGGYRSPASFRWSGAGSSAASRQRFRGGDAGHNYLQNRATGTPDPSLRILNPGDPRMTYYFRQHVQEENNYAADSTLGSRNSHYEASAEKPGSQVDLEFWPDGGYRTDTVTHPGSEETSPIEGNLLSENYSNGSSASLRQVSSTGETVYNARAPFRLSNLGRYYSLSELGNVYDPIMYPSTQVDNDPLQWLDATPGTPTKNATAQGGGNTLRIGRPEHPALASTPAAQLLDLFHVGVNGSNLSLHPDTPYKPSDYVQPPSARNAEFAKHHPRENLYGPYLHAESPFELIRGRLNINTASADSIRMLLEGVLAMDAGYGDDLGLDGRHAIQSLAQEIHDNRPYTALSQVAAIFHSYPPLFREGKSQSLDVSADVDGPRFAASDAVHEEPFARLMNLSQLSSRHFRIHVAGDFYSSAGKENSRGTVQRVYEVFLRPVHDLTTGKFLEVHCEVLNMRER